MLIAILLYIFATNTPGNQLEEEEGETTCEELASLSRESRRTTFGGRRGGKATRCKVLEED